LFTVIPLFRFLLFAVIGREIEFRKQIEGWGRQRLPREKNIKKECQKNERRIFMRQYNKKDKGKNLVVLLFHKNFDLIQFYKFIKYF
jgi:hypothetical protein